MMSQEFTQMEAVDISLISRALAPVNSFSRSPRISFNRSRLPWLNCQCRVADLHTHPVNIALYL